jgi:NADPH:quinone reductase-like Zn-dependent oxidoreductase
MYHEYGPSDALRHHEERVAARTDSVLIRVHAVAASPWDRYSMLREPQPMSGLGVAARTSLGLDFAGVVEGAGEAVTAFHAGDAVYGSCDGIFAGYACAPETAIALKPISLDFQHAASVPLAGSTALQGLRDHARLQPGENVLITDASSAVGRFAIQIAKYFGARVTAACNTRNAELVWSLGAKAVIDDSPRDLAEALATHDVVFQRARPNVPAQWQVERCTADLEVLAALIDAQTLTLVIDRE